ncbi:hypothetical protein WJ97_13380 [Burkholderia ubonensis]|uniref:hypothetical protein n=1 Tax=Burkholderia ubonensis TaxID=101571 RepID=UPI00075B9D96|nr:hypothetical protein [Burkholderia ubonensis]KVP75399.1 hypothetical protein WJ93_08265 [Burkholderia ubonensis]KVP96863.1 hypothetical protein WJ97_13380 [Burkholderia ubonensis]
MQTIRAILFAVLLALGVTAQAQTLKQFVIANDVEVQYFNGEMRFCERENLKGITCGFQQKLFGFGKKHFAARDWWSPETYVQARTGLNEFTLWGVEPTSDGRGIIIYFSQ